MQKLLVKLGISNDSETQRSDYWTCYSWQSCLEQMNVDADICFFGDSITQQTDFQAYFTDFNIVNLGLAGDSLELMMQRIDTVAAITPEKVVIEGGINGFADLLVSGTVDSYKNLLNKIKEKLPSAEIYVCGIFPLSQSKEENDNNGRNNKNILEADNQIKTLCEQMNITYIDIYNQLINDDGYLAKDYTVDGMHLTAEGSSVWLSILNGYIGE